MDDVDQCPDEPEDLDGFEDENGCPDPDNDGDGILDEPDQCPMEPEDIDGFEDEDGCPDPDNDQDTVLDEPDRCPNVPGPPDNDGCPSEAEIEESRIIILRRVEFETDSEILAESSHTVHDAVRQVLEENPQLRRIRIEGHTDDRDTDRHNMDLSRRRARSVGRWLVEHGIASRRLRAFGCGEAHPLQSNGTEEGMQANRRVEFHIIIPAPAGAGTLPGCRRLSL